MFVGSANMARFLYGSLAVILSIGLLWINCAVHTAPAIGTLGEMRGVQAQLDHPEDRMHAGLGQEMQALFPVGSLFTHALYGFT